MKDDGEDILRDVAPVGDHDLTLTACLARRRRQDEVKFHRFFIGDKVEDWGTRVLTARALVMTDLTALGARARASVRASDGHRLD